jgi:nucleotide-binding universal stress UspA family protein
MHSVTDINKFAGFYVPHMNTSNLSEQMVSAAKDKLYAICTRTIGEVDASHRIIKEGDPLKAIYDVIDEYKIDLLVIGHEFTTFSLFGGDYVQRFLKNPSCPVLVYPITGE